MVSDQKFSSLGDDEKEKLKQRVVNLEHQLNCEMHARLNVEEQVRQLRQQLQKPVKGGLHTT